MGRRKAAACSMDVIEQRFWIRVNKTETCWLWTAACRRGGYGAMWDGTKINAAHRLSWEIANGKIVDDLCVLHKCDTPACVRPDHLFLGTVADNQTDMKLKGRRKGINGGLVGSNHGMAKLSNEQVLEIRKLADAGKISKRQIARRFCVTHPLISQIHKRKVWRHI